MATPTSAQVGMPVTVIFDGTSYPAPTGETITNSEVGMEVTYIPPAE